MSPSKIVIDGKLTVPLFHGTSTLFTTSIRETGLGGRRLLDDIGLGKTARALLGYEEQLENVTNWEFEKPLLLRIADASQNPVGSFLRYSCTYMTPSRQTAARYALLNNCGSEVLASTLKILKALLAQLPDLASQEPFSTVLDFAGQPKSPVVVEANDVEVDCLLTERGQSCEQVLEALQDALDDLDRDHDYDLFDTWVQQMNFELARPVPPSQLRFHRIVVPQSGHDSMENLQLVPL
jgi:hypothetical protein